MMLDRPRVEWIHHRASDRCGLAYCFSARTRSGAIWELHIRDKFSWFSAAVDLID